MQVITKKFVYCILKLSQTCVSNHKLISYTSPLSPSPTHTHTHIGQCVCICLFPPAKAVCYLHILMHTAKNTQKYRVTICEKCTSLIDIGQANKFQLSRQDSANTRGNLRSALIVIIITHHTDITATTYCSIPETIYIKVCRLPRELYTP